MLSNHKFDINQNKKYYHKHPEANNKKEDKEDEDTIPWTFAQMEGRCYCCRKLGNKYPDCRTKYKIPKAEWTINKDEQHVQSKNYDNKSTSGSSLLINKEDSVVVWEGLNC